MILDSKAADGELASNSSQPLCLRKVYLPPKIALYSVEVTAGVEGKIRPFIVDHNIIAGVPQIFQPVCEGSLFELGKGGGIQVVDRMTNHWMM